MLPSGHGILWSLPGPSDSGFRVKPPSQAQAQAECHAADSDPESPGGRAGPSESESSGFRRALFNSVYNRCSCLKRSPLRPSHPPFVAWAAVRAVPPSSQLAQGSPH